MRPANGTGSGGAADDDLDALIRATSPAAGMGGGRGGGTVPTPAEAPAPARIDPFDVMIGTAETPIGWLSLALTQRGIAACSFDPEDVLAPRLARLVSPDIGGCDARLDPIRRELDAYFEGRLTSFTTPLDLRLTSDFSGALLRAVLGVPYAATTTYGRLGQRIGRPRAVRAVTNTLETNPLCVLVPCHRIVPDTYPEDIGGYAGDPEAKHYLLTLEEFARR